jgi:restriction system protein
MKEFLEGLGRRLKKFETRHCESMGGIDGEYEFDVVARFEAVGAEILILMECKHHRNLSNARCFRCFTIDRLHSVGAHKGMVFATSGFQSGAVEYAQAHGIALVQVVDGTAFYRAWDGLDLPLSELPPEVPKYGGWLVSLNEGGQETYSAVTRGRFDPLRRAIGWNDAL